MNGLPVKNAQLFAQDANLLIGTGPERAKLEAKFWSKVNKGIEDKCWVWAGSTNDGGYGVFTLGKHVDHRTCSTTAHRVSYWLTRGPISMGLEIDHLCRNRRCVNPSHLDLVTHQVNISRGTRTHHNKRKSHCPLGHPYDSVNTLYNKRGERRCRICKAMFQRRHREELRRISRQIEPATFLKG